MSRSAGPVATRTMLSRAPTTASAALSSAHIFTLKVVLGPSPDSDICKQVDFLSAGAVDGSEDQRAFQSSRGYERPSHPNCGQNRDNGDSAMSASARAVRHCRVISSRCNSIWGTSV
jgi:hypothetical protein